MLCHDFGKLIVAIFEAKGAQRVDWNQPLDCEGGAGRLW